MEVGPSGRRGERAQAGHGVVDGAPRAVTVTADGKTKVYGNADPALTYQITNGSLAFSDAFTGGLTRAAGESVGSYAITQGTLALSSNYTLSFVGANLSITPRAVTVTAEAKMKTYGNADPALTYQITSGTLVFSDAFTGGLNRAAGENVGSYAIQQGTLVLSSNYNLTVTAASLTITASNASRVYGVANPAFTGTLSGVRNGDNITATYASAAAPSTAVGTYSPASANAIVPTLVDPGNRLANYSVTSSNGTLTITQRTTVTTVSLAANPLNEGSSTAATVTVTDTSGPALVNVDPSGTVSLSASGSLVLSATSCTLTGNSSGVSTCQVMVTGSDNPGGTLTASFAGDALHVGSTSSGLAVTVHNLGPAFDLGANEPLPAGSGVFSRGPISFTDPGADVWSGTVNYGDGSGVQLLTINQAARTFALGRTYTTSGMFTVTVVLNDDDGGTLTDTFTVTVSLNSPPVVAHDRAALTVNEGSPASNTGTFSDAQGNSTVTLAASLGTITQNNATGTWSWSYTPSDGPAGPITVTITATDNTGLTATTSFTLTVNNVAPMIVTLTSSAPNTCSAAMNTQVALTGSFTDPSSADRHNAVIHWGDGTQTVLSATDPAINQAARTFSANHQYTTGGTFTITVTLTDDDNGSTTQTTTAFAGGVGLQNGVLEIIGGNLRDHVRVRLHGGYVKVYAKMQLTTHTDDDDDLDDDDNQEPDHLYVRSQYNPAQVNSIRVSVCGGNDRVHINRSIVVPTFLDGGAGDDRLWSGSGNATVIDPAGNNRIHTRAGNDVVTTGAGHDHIWTDGGNDRIYAGAGNDRVKGGAGNDIIVGGDGDDLLVGDGGRDLLIGGRGADRMVGDGEEDILIAGYTTFDANEQALLDIMAEWTSARSYAEREANLTGRGTGPRNNGSTFLIVDGANRNAFDDGVRDVLTGGAGRDWFLANLDQGVRDCITDLHGGEFTSDLDFINS